MKPRYTLIILIAFVMGISLSLNALNHRRFKKMKEVDEWNTQEIRRLIPKTANLYFQLGVFCGSQVKGSHPEYDQWEIDNAALQKAKEVAPSDEYLGAGLMPIKPDWTNYIAVKIVTPAWVTNKVVMP